MEKINDAMFDYNIRLLLSKGLDLDLLPLLMDSSIFGYKVCEYATKD